MELRSRWTSGSASSQPNPARDLGFCIASIFPPDKARRRTGAPHGTRLRLQQCTTTSCDSGEAVTAKGHARAWLTEGIFLRLAGGWSPSVAAPPLDALDLRLLSMASGNEPGFARSQGVSAVERSMLTGCERIESAAWRTVQNRLVGVELRLDAIQQLAIWLRARDCCFCAGVAAAAGWEVPASQTGWLLLAVDLLAGCRLGLMLAVECYQHLSFWAFAYGPLLFRTTEFQRNNSSDEPALSTILIGKAASLCVFTSARG